MEGKPTKRQGRKEASACFLAESQACSGSDGFISWGQESYRVYLGWQHMLYLKGRSRKDEGGSLSVIEPLSTLAWAPRRKSTGVAGAERNAKGPITLSHQTVTKISPNWNNFVKFFPLAYAAKLGSAENNFQDVKKSLSASYNGWVICDQAVPDTCSDQTVPKPSMELTQTQPLPLINELFIRRFLPPQLWKLCDESRAGTTTRRQPGPPQLSCYGLTLLCNFPLNMFPQGWSDTPTSLWQSLQSHHRENCLHLLKCEPQNKIFPLDLQLLTMHVWEWTWLWPSNGIASVSELGKKLN